MQLFSIKIDIKIIKILKHYFLTKKKQFFTKIIIIFSQNMNFLKLKKNDFQVEQRLLEKSFNDTVSSLDKEIDLDTEADAVYLTKTVKEIRKRQSNVFNLHCEKIAVVNKIQNIVFCRLFQL